MARGPIEDIYGLTDLQRAMLVRCASYPDQPLFMGQWWAVLSGPLDQGRFAAAWASVVQRHTALRSGFHWELKGAPAQVVLAAPAFEVERLDWHDVDDWRSALDALLQADRATPFDLRRPPLMRVRLVTLPQAGSAPRHLLVWTRHHLAVDGWSLGDILEEVLGLYRGAPLPPALPFRRYVDWWQGRDDSKSRAHWQARLAGYEPAWTAQSTTASAPRIGEALHILPPAAAERLAALARAERLTLSTLVEGAWSLVLARAEGTDDVVLGCIETVRPPELLGDRSSHMVGPQIGVLPSRVRRDATPLRAWLAALQLARASGREAGPLGLDTLRELLGLPGDTVPLRSLIAVQTYPLALAAAFEAAGLEIVASGDITLPDLPLNLMVEIGAAFELRLMVDQRYVALAQAHQLLAMLATALERLPGHLDAPADTLDVMPETQRREIAAALTGRPLPPVDGTVVDLILGHMRATPDAPALIARGMVWTYGALGAQAAALAARLAAAGVTPGARVAVMLDHGPEAVAAILGSLFAGAAYVPLDPDAPAERRRMILATAGVRVLVTRRGLAADLMGDDAALTVLAIEDDSAAPGALAAITPPAASDEAYVIFTSGSTGRPKGVSVGHDNLRYHVAASATENADLAIGRFLLTFPLFFDGSVTGLFCTLCDGGTLVLPDPTQARDADRLVALIHATGITHVCLTPSLWGLLLEAAGPEGFPALRMAKVAAEPCPPALVAAHAARAPNAVLCNEYGPTEATVWVCVERCRPATTGASVAIGHPIPGTTLHVVDERDRPCPFETIGELVVTGPAVARAYIGAEPGVALRSPLVRADGTRAPCYRTGDRVSLGFDGRLFFHGRRDRQVKIGGYRIEPGEIEAALHAFPGLQEVALVVEESAGRPARLVAHLAPASALPDETALRAWLAARLPGYMIPQALVRHARLARTPNGKVDVAALTGPMDTDTGGAPPASVSPPQGPLETAIAALWAELLHLPTVGRDDHFFALGGSSLLAMQMIARLRREQALPATLADLFEAPQLAAFAGRLAAPPATAAPGPAPTLRPRTRVELPS